MTDITTTQTGIETDALTIPGTPAVTDRRGGYAGELARAEAALAEARAAVTARDRIIEQLRTEQITDGDDPRLVEFAEKAGRIADRLELCDDYDRIAEAVHFPPRLRDWDVTLDVTVTVRVTYSANATTSDDAADIARDEITFEEVIEAYRENGADEFDTSVYSVDRQ